MKNRLYAIAALLLAIGVACGAFGAHALRGSIPDTDLDIWEKAVFYQLVHGLAALLVLVTPASLLEERRGERVAKLFLVGMVIFSGSLYTLVLTNERWLGAITPIGGLMLILSWILLSLAAMRHRRN